MDDQKTTLRVQKACLTCGHVGTPRLKAPGSTAITLILFCFYIIPGIIYQIWRNSSVKEVCELCGGTLLVPPNSPAGRKVVDENGNESLATDTKPIAEITGKSGSSQKLGFLNWIDQHKKTSAVIGFGTIFLFILVPILYAQYETTLSAPYHVISTENTSYSGCRRVTERITIPDNATPTEADAMLGAALDSLKSTGQWDDITIWAWKNSEVDEVGAIPNTMGTKTYSVCS